MRCKRHRHRHVKWFFVFVVSCRYDKDETSQQRDEGGERHTESIHPVVEIGNGEHRQHEKAFDEQQLAFDAEN